MRIFIIILIVIASTASCNTQKPEQSQLTDADFELPEVKAALRARHDTRVTTPDGRILDFHVNTKEAAVNTELNGLVMYAYNTWEGEYTYDSVGNISKQIIKEELWNDSLGVVLRDDSIRINENFILKIWVGSAHYRIVITSPYQDTLASETLEADIETVISHNFATPGIYNCEGTIIYPTGPLHLLVIASSLRIKLVGERKLKT